MHAVAVCVKRTEAQRALEILRQRGLIVSGLRPVSLGEHVCFPSSSEHAKEVLSSHGISPTEPPPGIAFQERRAMPRGLPAHVLVGDILVFNWRSEVPREVYEEAARIIMSHQPKVKAAILKRETWGELRAQRVEHLAGERRTETVHREYGLLFHVNLATTYFNPRLAEEHKRVAERCRDGERVLDMFAGVGGFSLYIASRCRSLILAVDLNVHAISSLARNIAMNRKRLIGEVIAMRADAEILPRLLKPVFDRIIIDNPTAASRFLPIALGLAKRGAEIHYYTLSYSCETAMEEAGLLPNATCRRVLEYSPSRAIYSLTAIV